MKIKNMTLTILMTLSFNLIPADEGQGKEGQVKDELLSNLINENIIDIALKQIKIDDIKTTQDIFKIIQNNSGITSEQLKKYILHLLEMKSHYEGELKINCGSNRKEETFRKRYEEAKNNLNVIEDIMNKMRKMEFEGLNIDQIEKESAAGCIIA